MYTGSMINAIKRCNFFRINNLLIGGSMEFSPCIGKCTDQSTHCEGCGRSHEDVAETNQLIMQLVNYAREKGYENIEEFADSMGHSILYKLQNPS